MAHYAFFNENNVVFQVIAGRDEGDLVEGVESWENYYGDLRGSVCRQTSYNTRGGVHYNPETGEPSADQAKALRYNYAGIGYTYDEARDAFIPPKPYDSWVLDEDTCLWVAPISMPEKLNAEGEPIGYLWDEDTQSWTELVDETE